MEKKVQSKIEVWGSRERWKCSPRGKTEKGECGGGGNDRRCAGKAKGTSAFKGSYKPRWDVKGRSIL